MVGGWNGEVKKGGGGVARSKRDKKLERLVFCLLVIGVIRIKGLK